MPDDLLIARNPEPGSTLPYLVRIPLGDAGIVLKTKSTWPREAKVYCHRAEAWPEEPDVVERLEVQTCRRRGAAIDLVLTRSREKRSQFVITRARGREMIFWQSPRTTKQARPGTHLPTARAHGQVLEILIDSGEKYPYRFSHQQADTVRRRLPAGDYAVEIDDVVVAAVERKTVADLSSSLLSGRMTYALAELSALPRAAVCVEEGYSKIFKQPRQAGGPVAESLAEAQARFPTVPIVFCETRPLAEEWTYRWLGACRHELDAAEQTRHVEQTFATAADAPVSVPPRPVPAREIREWARRNGLPIPDKGRIPAAIRDRWEQRET